MSRPTWVFCGSSVNHLGLMFGHFGLGLWSGMNEAANILQVLKICPQRDSSRVWKFGSLDICEFCKFRSFAVWNWGPLEIWKIGSVEVQMPKLGSLESLKSDGVDIRMFRRLEVWKSGSLQAWTFASFGSLEIRTIMRSCRSASLELWNFGKPEVLKCGSSDV
jgi:hypothetical protein